MMDNNHGHLFTFSGLDGAGKTTQVAALRHFCERHGQRCLAYQFRPEDVGAEGRRRIRSILAAEPRWLFTRLRMDWGERYPLLDGFVHDPSLHKPEIALASALAFAGAALQVAEFGLKPLIEAGVNIVCDRYWFDDLVFRSLWVEPDLIARLYRQVPIPNVAFLLRTPPTLCEQRNRGRPDEQNPILNNPVLVRRMHRSFDDVGRDYGLTVIDGARSPPDIAHQVRKHIAAHAADWPPSQRERVRVDNQRGI